MRSISIISDIHIESERDPAYASLLKWFRDRPDNSIVVLAGDVFDLWVSDKRVFVERYRDFLYGLDALSARGCEVHYVEGNHDFFLSDFFAEGHRVRVHAERLELDCSTSQGPRKLLVEHGDLADSKDYGYRLLRAFFRSRAFHGFVRSAPDAWIERIGDFARKRSRARHPLLPQEWNRTDLERLRAVYRAYVARRFEQGYDWIVLGHCHDCDTFHVNESGRERMYWNLGFPKVHRKFLTWTPGSATLTWQPFL